MLPALADCPTLFSVSHYSWPPGLMVFLLCRGKHFILEQLFPDSSFYRTGRTGMSKGFYWKTQSNGVMDFLLLFLFAGMLWSLVFGLGMMLMQYMHANSAHRKFTNFQLSRQLGADTIRFGQAYELRSFVQSIYYGVAVLLMLKFLFASSQAAQLLAR